MISSPHTATPRHTQRRSSKLAAPHVRAPIRSFKNPERPQPCSRPDTDTRTTRIALEDELKVESYPRVQASAVERRVGRRQHICGSPIAGKKYSGEAIEAQFEQFDPLLTGQPSELVELQRESLRQRNINVNNDNIRSTVAHTCIASRTYRPKALEPHATQKSTSSLYNKLQKLAQPPNTTNNPNLNKHYKPQTWAGTPSPPPPPAPPTLPTPAAPPATTHAPPPAPVTPPHTGPRQVATAASHATATYNTCTASCANSGATSYTTRVDTRIKSSSR
jgi:hypothetical protein